jgi:hypothetical protein
MVRTNTIALRACARRRARQGEPALAMSVDGNGRFCALDRPGRRLAVAEAARNVACAGALPIGATNCLNFGNPERPRSCGSLPRPWPASAKRAARSTCRSRRQRQPLQRDGRPRDSADASHRRRRCHRARVERADAHVSAARHDIVLLGENRGELGGSEYPESDPWPGARRAAGARSRARARAPALLVDLADRASSSPRTTVRMAVLP